MRLSSDDDRMAFLAPRASMSPPLPSPSPLSRRSSPSPSPSFLSYDDDLETGPFFDKPAFSDHILSISSPSLASSVFSDRLSPSRASRASRASCTCWSRLQRVVACLVAAHRSRRRRSGAYRACLTFLKVVVHLCVALFVLTPILAPSYTHPPAHYRELAARCHATASLYDRTGCANPHNQQVFISVSLWDEGGRLADGRWGGALVELVSLLGPTNVFVSIYENDSGAAGAAALARLRDRLESLGSRHALVYDDHVPLDAFPTVVLPDGSHRTKRIAYLAAIRNRALQPLDTLGAVNGTHFDKVLFLNDVAFRPIDAAQLLFSTGGPSSPGSNNNNNSYSNNSNNNNGGGGNYLAACALDWKRPFAFYDIFAQRDAEGYSNGVPIFPIFSGAGRGLSRAAMRAQSDAVPVQGCWGGMVAMQAAYVQNRQDGLPWPSFQNSADHVVNPAQPNASAAAVYAAAHGGQPAPVRFRYEPELYVEGCECCLFLADAAAAAKATAAATATGGQQSLPVVVNPYVRVAYHWQRLPWVRIIQRWERLLVLPQAIATRLTRRLPTYNPHRTVAAGTPFVEEVWDPDRNVWTRKTRAGRTGLFCNVREMQLLTVGPRTGDENWEHVPVPPGQKLYFPT
ncbi:Mannosyltransferase 1, CMT1 [Niveomyces insectorum RCEF 264]|uniref:Mannosyltransferase 1, CMT1 n=1 Tax=Niveomyces insectorum RCEF 264 TaxID=1081102 RepID=A0A167SS06_9HYPO|nr:Mannosyltransferase 1, CMT1 [Niveomyces insectorum RCEF 264]